MEINAVFRAEIQSKRMEGNVVAHNKLGFFCFFFFLTETKGTFSKYVVKVRFHVISYLSFV